MAGLVVLLVLLAIPVGFAAWAASLAEQRGRAPGAHAALGFFFGPIGVLITALRGPDHVALANKPPVAPNPSSLRGCPHCGRNVNVADSACPSCGVALGR